ncbi:unnamed protein product [Notodromas monacha]|uniref:Uncharacterized protein n=1 Tax=Notodromas monacha TaxID=399045 RepID=A0A7R9GIF8_9CRUS|nr:unnamed protein product [Notodromas monacha]CAG0922549.1 unnamed protein product [Notodromas monacha]
MRHPAKRPEPELTHRPIESQESPSSGINGGRETHEATPLLQPSRTSSASPSSSHQEGTGWMTNSCGRCDAWCANAKVKAYMSMYGVASLLGLFGYWVYLTIAYRHPYRQMRYTMAALVTNCVLYGAAAGVVRFRRRRLRMVPSMLAV